MWRDGLMRGAGAHVRARNSLVLLTLDVAKRLPQILTMAVTAPQTLPTPEEIVHAPPGDPDDAGLRPARHRVHRSRWIGLAMIALLLVAGVFAYRYVAQRHTAPHYLTARVERGPLTATVASTGNLNAVIMVVVGSQVSGTIKELDADFNTVVRTGQVIARIDDALFEAAVHQAAADLAAARSTVRNQQALVEEAQSGVANAEAAHAEAKAQTAKALVAVVDAQRDLGRKTQLFRQQLIAEADRDSAQTTYDAAVAQHESAQAHERALAVAIDTATGQLRAQEAALETAREQVKQREALLSQAQINLDHTTIRSPVDGVVVNRHVDVGQTVAAALQAPTLFTIAQDLTQMQVETSVDEAEIGRIRADTPVTFTVDAFPGEIFTGRVAQIRKAPQVVQNVVTYTVVVAAPNPAGKLLPGMTANVRFVVAHEPNALKVPNTALRFDPGTLPATTPAAVSHVWTVGADGRPASVPVTVGISDGTSTQIVRGEIAEGAAVIVGGEASAPATSSSAPPRLRF
jgi:HlyD family secretion protein